jgi:outer membrane immunogenic protein
MNRLLFAISSLIGFVAPALAADMAAEPAPPPSHPSLWTGPYIGLNAGWIWSSTTIKNIGTDSGTSGLGAALYNGFIPGSIAVAPNGFIGGAQAGYRWQYAEYWVLGVEADFAGTSAKANIDSAFFGNTVAPPFSTFFKTELDALGTVRGEIGYLWSPLLLFYGTAGLAYGQTKLGSAFACSACISPSGLQGSATLQTSKNSTGWTAGGGVEWKLSASWSTKLEYLYVNLGGQSDTIVYGYLPAPNTSSMTSTIPWRDNVVRVGVNYRFF